MKFYNPFKPHICKNANGTYSVRKLNIFGWSKIDSDSNWWTIESNQLKYCQYSAEQSLLLLDRIVQKNNLRDEYVSVHELREYVNRPLESAIW